MKYKNEVELMNALGIESWRNLSKDKMVRFAAMMPDTDPELALKVIEQFPEFKAFALDALDVIQQRHEATLGDNKESQEHVHRAFREIREILKGQLEKDDLSWDEKKYIIDLIMETGNREFEKDAENKRFLGDMFKTVAMVGVGALVAGLAVLGGKAMLESGEVELPS